MNKINRALRVLLLFVIALSVCACGPSTSRPVASKPLPAPKNLELSVTPQGLRANWDPVPGATRYTVFWGYEREDYKYLRDFAQPSATLAGLQKGRLYSVAVTCWNSIGESDYSAGQLVVYDDDPRHSSRYLSKGNELLNKGSLAEAQSYLSAAIRLDPNNVQAYQSRGLLFEKLDRPDLAKRDYAAATRILKTKPLTRMGVGFSQDRTTRQD